MYVGMYVCEYAVGVKVSRTQCLLAACKGHKTPADSLKHRPPEPPSQGLDWFGTGTGSSACSSPLGNVLGQDLLHRPPKVPAARCEVS